MQILVAKSIKEVKAALHSVPGHDFGANDELLAKRAGDLLNTKYPGYPWAVFVNSEEKGGVMYIKNFAVSYRYGYCLHLNKLDRNLDKVVRAGGEILERASLRRGTNNGQRPTHIEGVKAKHQPIPSRGIII